MMSAMAADNATMIEKLTGLPIIACVTPNATALSLDRETLLDLFHEETP